MNVKVAKLLDPKLSQNLGIMIRSQHIEISDVQNGQYHLFIVPIISTFSQEFLQFILSSFYIYPAVYAFDTSVINLQMLQQIYDISSVCTIMEI
jgi:hypothetical protein